MKKFKFTKNGAIATIAISAVIGIAGLVMAQTAPSLGVADSFAVLSGVSLVDSNVSVITGDVGLSPGTSFGALTSAEVSGTVYAVDASGPDGAGGNNPTLVGNAKTALTAAYLDAEGQTAPSVTALVDNTTDSFASLPSYVLAPGIYKSANQIGVPVSLTLNGSATDVWIFQAPSTLTTATNANIVLTGGAQACNVFWQVGSSATLGTGTLFKGSILALTDITDASGSTIQGRLLARNGTVTLNGTTVVKPTCAAVAGGSRKGTINVVKTVINDSGRTKTAADFRLYVNGGAVRSGDTNAFPTDGGVYTVTETVDPNYTRTFSGDCDVNGRMTLGAGDNRFCIVTNNDIGAVLPVVPPLIDLVKTASPLSLPAGPGTVVYTYTLHNTGTVPVTDITIVGDTCSPIILASGDTNNDAKLDLNETWINTCTQVLSETHTNTAVATGWANGISATDIASATVVVGAPIVPPLIHVLKVPNVFTLRFGGGNVTYSYTVTNPGTAPLSNVSIVDDKCTGLPGRVVGHPGDLNRNNLLESNETWQFTCPTRLTKTTTNIVTASGEANGLIAKDVALATVVVSSVKLPNTGYSPESRNLLNILVPAGVLALLFSAYIARRKRTV